MERRIDKSAQIVALCLFLVLVVPVAGAADALAAGLGGTLYYSYGFKPEFYESDGPGNYHLVGGSAALKSDGTSFRLGLSAIGTDTPEREITVNDPTASVSQSLALAEGGPVLTGALASSYGASLRSRDAGYRGSVTTSLSLSQQSGGLSVGVGGAVTRHLNRYTLAASGSPTAVYSTSASLSLGYAVTSALSAEASLAYVKTHRHAGADVYGYSNAVGLGYAVNEQFGVSVGLSTTDAQLAPDGSDNNELTLYKRNQTEGSVGFTYAL